MWPGHALQEKAEEAKEEAKEKTKEAADKLKHQSWRDHRERRGGCAARQGAPQQRQRVDEAGG